MKYQIGLMILAASMISPAFAADGTWTGKISDSMCGGKHMAGGEHAAAMSDADCTKACIDKGAKYVFVNDGKVYTISNQDFAGDKVKLTGEMTGTSIRVTKIEMPKKS